MQQKMMMYFMPAMFTVFMLFLPAGLGVYMFTNSVLAIIQQQAVERNVRKTMGRRAAKADVQTINTSGTDRLSGSPTKPGTKGGAQGAGRLLDKGKART
jgi:YidC/Oxa1 family membrane protein insertase